MKLHKILMTCIIALSLALSLGLGTSAMAGGDKHHKKHKWDQMNEQEKLEHMDKRLDKKLARLDKKLDLTDAQKTQVRQILETARTEMMDLKQSGEADRGEFKQIHQNKRAELNKVLTADQQQKYKEIKKTHRHKRGKKFGKRMFKKLDRKLDLDDQQAEQVKAIMKDTGQKIRQAKQENSGDRDAFRAAMKSAFEDGATKIEAILDADQKQTFQKMQQRMKQRFEHRRGK
jgi:Spy/CpxP family protein refolding chaperone